MKPESINRLAKKMMDNIKIVSRLSELKKPIVEKAQMTFGGHLKRLDDLSRAAEKAEQFGQATTTRSQQD